MSGEDCRAVGRAESRRRRRHLESNAAASPASVAPSNPAEALLPRAALSNRAARLLRRGVGLSTHQAVARQHQAGPSSQVAAP